MRAWGPALGVWEEVQKDDEVTYSFIKQRCWPQNS